MNRLLLIVMLFLCSSSVVAQERLTLSKFPSVEQIQSAKEIIKSAETAPTKMPFGGYALIDIKLEGKLTNYTVPGSDDCIKTVLIPKGQAYEGWLVDKATNEFKWTRIEPVAWDRLLVTGTKNGTATLIWMTVQNGEAVVVAAFQFVVGKPAPKPVDPPDDPVIPVDDDLTKAMRAAYAKDKVAGIGDPKYLIAMSGVYEAASNDSLDTIKTAGDLDDLLLAARKAAGIPEPDKVLTETRQFIKRQLLANLTGGVDAPATVMDAAKKTTAKTLMGKIAESLEKIVK